MIHFLNEIYASKGSSGIVSYIIGTIPQLCTVHFLTLSYVTGLFCGTKYFGKNSFSTAA